ncbi:zinc finger protein 24-like [Elgaria multicarinata webbii]|uniref:zinc finger protein 24-like n=1 Tax=Elgaria multicarinata webbii TaxID=159646 RepID=UPI002FCCE365
MQRLQAEEQTEIKMEEQEPDGAEKGEKSEVEQRDLPGVQVVTSTELQTGTTMRPIKPEPEEGLQQCWEAQWQEFLRTMQAPCLGWRPPQMPLPPSGESLKEFQMAFKGAAEPTLGPRREHVIQALPGLTREAHEAYERHLDFSVQVKEEILDDEDPVSPESCRQRFRRFCYWEAEGPRNVCRQLQELCRRWLEPDRRTKEQILELVALEQFLATLPEEMRSWVRGSVPETCIQAVALAEEFLLRLEKREQQKLEPFEEVIVNSPKAEQDPSDAEDMQLSLEVEQDSEGEADLYRSETEEQNLQPERVKRTEVSDISLETARGPFSQVPEADERPRSQQGLKQPQEKAPGQTLRHNADCRDEGDVSLNKSPSRERVPGDAAETKAAACGKSFSLGFGLAQPAKTPSYECSYCGKRWPCQSQLRRHVKIHTGERPHKCTDCGKSFSTSSNLSQHKRVHTGERPYSCKDCGKSYRRRASLVQHERETCRKGSHLNAPAVGYVVLGSCTLLCMKKLMQGGRNRVIAPKGGEAALAAQPLSILTGYTQERSHTKD